MRPTLGENNSRKLKKAIRGKTGRTPRSRQRNRLPNPRKPKPKNQRPIHKIENGIINIIGYAIQRRNTKGQKRTGNQSENNLRIPKSDNEIQDRN